MTKILVIENCTDCPKRSSTTQKTEPTRIPMCGATRQILPYTTEQGMAGIHYANPTWVIPKWCPLETLPPKVDNPA